MFPKLMAAVSLIADGLLWAYGLYARKKKVDERARKGNDGEFL